MPKEHTPRPGYTFPGKPPKEALEYFRRKGVKPSFHYADVWREEHAASFTAAKAMELDVLTAIRGEVDKALAQGRTLREFSRDLSPNLQKLGWWGRKEMADPITGEVRKVQLGSPRRLRTIYNTNMRTARAAGQWERGQRGKKSHPYLLYSLGPSREHRPEHMAWDGTLLPVDDPWWNTHMPPNGWGCKCRVRQVSSREAEAIPARREAPPMRSKDWRNRRTGETHRVPEGIDPGWDYNPGMAGRARSAARMYADKVATAPAALGASSFASLPREVLDNLDAEYRTWAAGIGKGVKVGMGGRRVVGAMTPKVLNRLSGLGVNPASAALTIEQREVTHLLAQVRKGGKALPKALVYDLVRLLDEPLAVVWDGAGRKPALLYVVAVPGAEKLGRIVVRVGYPMGKDATNAVRSASLVEPANLQLKGMVLLDGKIK